jgi:hypothetical protein
MGLINRRDMTALDPTIQTVPIQCQLPPATRPSFAAETETARYRVRVMAFTVGGAETVQIKSSDVLGEWDFPAAGDGIVLPDGDAGWFDTLPGEDFVINQTNGVGVKGTLRYIQLEG